MNDDVVTISDIAGSLKLSNKTAYSRAKRGELAAFKIPGQWRLRRVDLDACWELRQASLSTLEAERSEGRVGPPRGFETYATVAQTQENVKTAAQLCSA